MDSSARFQNKLSWVLAEMGEEGRKYDEANRLKGNQLGSRANKLHRILMVRREAGKPLGKLSNEEIRQVLLKRQASLSHGLFKATCVNLREFYKTVYGRKAPIEVPRGGKNPLPTVLKKDEVAKLIDNIPDLRDRTMIKLLYETGARPIEIATLTLKQVVFDEYGGYIIVQDTKTSEGSRRVRFVAVTPDLKAFLNQHPWKGDPDADLFYSYRKGKNVSITTSGIDTVVRKWSRKILGKVVSPKVFRHSRFTHLSGKLTDRVLKKLGGWKTSRMLEVYSHLSGEDVDAAVLGMYGITPEESVKPVLEIITCKKCGAKNNPSSIYCQNCGDALIMQTILRDKEMQKRDELMQRLVEKLAESTKRLEALECRLKEKTS